MARADRKVQHNEVARISIGKFGGRVVKYMGDGVMGVFEGDACESSALQASLDIICQMGVANQKQGWNDFPSSMSTKIGIHSGPVWMFKYDNSPEDPQGTTVDIASRLASMSGPNRVLCTKDVYETACKTHDFPSPSLEFKAFLKGIQERFEIRAIVPHGYSCDFYDVENPPRLMEEKIKEAYRLAGEKRIEEALQAFKQISNEWPGNFFANI